MASRVTSEVAAEVAAVLSAAGLATVAVLVAGVFAFVLLEFEHAATVIAIAMLAAAATAIRSLIVFCTESTFRLSDSCRSNRYRN
jgi:hypothetical protein